MWGIFNMNRRVDNLKEKYTIDNSKDIGSNPIPLSESSSMEEHCIVDTSI